MTRSTVLMCVVLQYCVDVCECSDSGGVTRSTVFMWGM